MQRCRVFLFFVTDRRMDVRTPYLKIMTTYTAGAWWVNCMILHEKGAVEQSNLTVILQIGKLIFYDIARYRLESSA